MAKAIPRVEIWKQEGTSAFTTWNDVLDLGRRADGSFRLRLRRIGLDDSGTSSVYSSKPFRTGDGLLKELRELAEAPGRSGSTRGVRHPSVSEVVSALAEVALWEAAFASDAL